MRSGAIGEVRPILFAAGGMLVLWVVELASVLRA